ncbi:hypothetical protein P3L10_033185 [Capsicum annuum]
MKDAVQKQAIESEIPFSKEQYSQFVQMVKQMKMKEGSNSGIDINANSVAGPFHEEASSFW